MVAEAAARFLALCSFQYSRQRRSWKWMKRHIIQVWKRQTTSSTPILKGAEETQLRKQQRGEHQSRASRKLEGPRVTPNIAKSVPKLLSGLLCPRGPQRTGNKCLWDSPNQFLVERESQAPTGMNMSLVGSSGSQIITNILVPPHQERPLHRYQGKEQLLEPHNRVLTNTEKLKGGFFYSVLSLWSTISHLSESVLDFMACQDTYDHLQQPPVRDRTENLIKPTTSDSASFHKVHGPDLHTGCIGEPFLLPHYL